MLRNNESIHSTNPLDIPAAFEAAANGNASVIRAFAEAGGDLNQRNDEYETLAYIAAKNGHVEVINALVAANANLEISKYAGETPVHVAVSKGHLDVVKALANAKADLNKADINEYTPAIIAAYKGDVDIINVLAAANADMSKPGNGGTTPASSAAMKGHVEVLKALLAAKADLGKADSDGRTPAYMAAQEVQIEAIEVLAAANVKLNQADNDGKTPAWFAAARGQINVLRALSKAGVDLAEKTRHGSPLTVAFKWRSSASCEWLIANGFLLGDADEIANAERYFRHKFSSLKNPIAETAPQFNTIFNRCFALMLQYLNKLECAFPEADTNIGIFKAVRDMANAYYVLYKSAQKNFALPKLDLLAMQKIVTFLGAEYFPTEKLEATLGDVNLLPWKSHINIVATKDIVARSARFFFTGIEENGKKDDMQSRPSIR